MAGWYKHLQAVLRQISSRNVHKFQAPTNHFGASARFSPLLGHPSSLQSTLAFPSGQIQQPFYYYLQRLGVSSSRQFLAEASADANIQPISSPLTPLLGSTGKEKSDAVVSKPSRVQAVLKGIKQSPKKVNLVAALVRGMRVEDALLQLQVTVKRASKTVYKVIHSARANATHNHGLDPDRLLVAEAFVGKGFYKKRISYHSKMRHGIKVRPECRLTVVVREISPEEEAEIARLRVSKFRKLTKRERQLVPHKLIETTPRWHRKRKGDEPAAGVTA
ncbi:50S ribosomal protein L22 [Nymphaea thermarum]|nr:50S ribosomal protein L22 [Nymphaea thermarum]